MSFQMYPSDLLKHISLQDKTSLGGSEFSILVSGQQDNKIYSHVSSQSVHTLYILYVNLNNSGQNEIVSFVFFIFSRASDLPFSCNL